MAFFSSSKGHRPLKRTFSTDPHPSSSRRADRIAPTKNYTLPPASEFGLLVSDEDADLSSGREALDGHGNYGLFTASLPVSASSYLSSASTSLVPPPPSQNKSIRNAASSSSLKKMASISGTKDSVAKRGSPSASPNPSSRRRDKDRERAALQEYENSLRATNLQSHTHSPSPVSSNSGSGPTSSNSSLPRSGNTRWRSSPDLKAKQTASASSSRASPPLPQQRSNGASSPSKDAHLSSKSPSGGSDRSNASASGSNAHSNQQHHNANQGSKSASANASAYHKPYYAEIDRASPKSNGNVSMSMDGSGQAASDTPARPPRSTRPPVSGAASIPQAQSQTGPVSLSVSASDSTSSTSPFAISPSYPPSTLTSTSNPSSYNITPTQDTYTRNTPRASTFASPRIPAPSSPSVAGPSSTSHQATDTIYTTSPVSLASTPSPLTPPSAPFSHSQPSSRGSSARRGDEHEHDRHSPLHQQQQTASNSTSANSGLHADRYPHGHIPRGYLSSGSASDTSYGSPLSELGYSTMNMKRLLSKPAARPSTSGTMSISGPSDTEQMASAAAIRRRVETSPAAPGKPTVSGSSIGVQNDDVIDSSMNGARKMTTSNPEHPRSFSSLGRVRGQEWGHVLARQTEPDRDRDKRGPRGRHTDGEHDRLQHMRSHSSFSLSSPSEGASPYPYGLALERKMSASAALGGAGRPQIHLTTGLPRRLSAFSTREADSGSPMSATTAGGKISPNVFVQSPSASHTLNADARQRQTSRQQAPSSQGQSQLNRSRTNKDVGVSCRKDSPPPPGLTPAELVAHSYKQQERRRAELARGALRDVDHPIRVKNSGPEEARGRLRQRTTSGRDEGVESTRNVEEDEDVTPYYTVFGNTTGRVIAIGNERDSAFGLFESDRKMKLDAKAAVAEVSGAASVIASGIAQEGRQDPNNANPPQTLRRKLSRKLSGKLKRDGSTVRGGGREKDKESKHSGELKKGEDSREFGDESMSIGGRPSTTATNRSTAMEVQGRRSATLPRERPHPQSEGRSRRGSLKISMDDFVTVHHTELDSGCELPSAGNGVPVSVNSPAITGTWIRDDHDRIREKARERERVVSESGARTRGKAEKEKGEKAANSPTSGKIWGLVKRISSTALKDKFSKGASEDPPPPVPALPRELIKITLNREESLSSERSSEKSGSPIVATFRKAYSSLPTSARPQTAPTSMGTPTKAGSTLASPVEGRIGVGNQRPSATTRSSSPISSDKSSNNYFKSTQSNRSSTSSYGEVAGGQGSSSNREQGPSYIGQHILPPEKLLLLEQERSRNRQPENDTKGEYAGLKEEVKGFEGFFSGEEWSSSTFQALPVPPRRNGGDGRKRDASADSRPPSPSIPVFSTDNAVNTFGFRAASKASTSSALQGSDFGVTSPTMPPPRPARSPRRNITAPSVFGDSSQEQLPTNSVPLTKPFLPEERVGRVSIGALSQASTARPSTSTRRDSLGDSRTIALSPTTSGTSTLTFRDVSSAQRQAWSDAEKTAKWEALLAKSEQAGGTLHVGLGGLLSDNIRDSLSIRDSTYTDF